MLTIRQLSLSLILLSLAVVSGSAQTQITASQEELTSKTNIIIERQLVRFTTPGEAVEWHLVVTNQQAEVIFDSGLVYGTTLEWPLKNQQNEAVQGGLYAYTLTTKTATDEAPRTQRGHLIVARASSNDRVWLTSTQPVGIGADSAAPQVTVSGSNEATVGGAEFPGGVPRTEASGEHSAFIASGRSLSGIAERSDLQRAIAGRRPAEPAQKNSAAGLTPPVKTNIPDDLVVNGNFIFTPPSQGFTRDITMQNNNGGLRFFGAPTLTTSPAAAAIQFWGNASPFPGQLYLDSGAHDNAALIFRTAPSGGTIAEQMRVTSAGNVGIGTNNPSAKLHVAGGEVLFENKWRTETTAYTPNLIGGFLGTGSGGATPGNRVTAGVVGATIGGGGYNGSISFPTIGSNQGDISNRVTDWFGTVGGGLANLAGNNDATLDNASFATVGGGYSNIASGLTATVGGGYSNFASGYIATVSGGSNNIASGVYATVPGGTNNTAQGDNSFAAGRQAKANHQGTFVWADSTNADFASTGDNQFLIRASGGVGIGTPAPQAQLHVSGGAILLDNNQGLFLKDTAGAQKRAILGDVTNRLRIGSGGSLGFDEIRFDLASPGTVMTLFSNGGVGVGTVPGYKLDVNGTGRFQGKETGAASGAGVEIQYGAVGGANRGIIFAYDRATSTPQDLLLNHPGGNVGIGTTAPTTFKLQVAGSVGPNSDNSSSLGDAMHRWTAVYAVNGTIQTSDARLKQRVSNLRYGLREVLQLRPVSFEWKDQAAGKLNLGLLAQEVEPLIPEVVVREANPTTPLGMNYSGLVPVVIKAIQEQQATIITLKAENAALNTRLTALEAALQQLKQQQAQAPPAKLQKEQP